MSEDVIAGKTPVCHEDRAATVNITVYQPAESGKFVFEPAWLDDYIQIPPGKQVIERNGVERVEASVRPATCRMEGGSVLWVSGNVKFAPVSGNEGIPAHKTPGRETEVKVFENVTESFWEKLSPLLNEGGSSGDFLRQEIKIFQQFMIDTSAFHAEEEMDELDKPQFPVTGKILFGVFDKAGRVAGHVVHDCPECGLNLLWE